MKERQSRLIKRDEFCENIGDLPCDKDLDELLHTLSPQQFNYYRGLTGEEAKPALEKDIRIGLLFKYLLNK